MINDKFTQAEKINFLAPSEITPAQQIQADNIQALVDNGRAFWLEREEDWT